MTVSSKAPQNTDPITALYESKPKFVKAMAFPAVFAIVSMPFILSFYKVGIKTIFGCYAADSMIYLAIARHSVNHGFFTINQETITNGFQPMWQYILVIVQLITQASVDNLLLLSFILCLAFVTTGLFGVIRGVFLYWGLRTSSLLLFLMMPGLFSLFFEPSIGHESLDSALLYSFTGWAFVNGVESGLTIAAFGLLIMTTLSNLSKANINDFSATEIFSFWPRIFLAIIVLSRLDDIFVFLALAISMLIFQQGNYVHRIRNIVTIALPAFVLVVLYMIYNYVTLGVPLPVSGLSKTGVAISNNFDHLISVLGNFNATKASRILPMLTLMFSGGFVFIYSIFHLCKNKQNLVRRDQVIVAYLFIPLSGYIFFKATFHFTLVEMWYQGWWYYSGQIFIFNFLLGLVISRILSENVHSYTIALFISGLLCFVQVFDTGHRLVNTKGYASTFFDLWENKDNINKALTSLDIEMKVIDNTDGMYSFILDMPSGLGTGLAFSTEKERKAAAEKGDLNALFDQGFTVIPLKSSSKWEGHYYQLGMLKELKFRHEKLFKDPISGVTFYQLTRYGENNMFN